MAESGSLAISTSTRATVDGHWHGPDYGAIEHSERKRCHFTFIDRLTKMVQFVPTVSFLDTKEAAQLYVNKIFARHGFSKMIVSDLTFVSLRPFSRKRLPCWVLNANHPQTEGQTERMNRAVEETSCFRDSQTG